MTTQELDFKREMLWLTVIYRMLECGDSIPLDTDGTPYAFIEEDLREMHRRELVQIRDDNTCWRPTEKAEQLRNKMVAMFDQALKFEIFAAVNLTLELGEDLSEDGLHVFDHVYDPRFQPPETPEQADELGTEDLRLAMITYLAKCFSESDAAKDLGGRLDVDPHRVVFLQRLADGKLKDDNIWFDLKLGTPFKEVEEIVESAYRYTDVSDDPEEVDRVMQNIYTAGMLEQRKREGHECTKCEIPLAVFEMNAKEEGSALTHCPNPDCGEEFHPPAPPPGANEYECPSCETTVYAGQHFCRGCGARLDFSLPEGTVEVTRVEEREYDGPDYGYVWGGYYDYVPYGYYHPYDPFYDVAAFAVLCAVLW